MYVLWRDAGEKYNNQLFGEAGTTNTDEGYCKMLVMARPVTDNEEDKAAEILYSVDYTTINLVGKWWRQQMEGMLNGGEDDIDDEQMWDFDDEGRATTSAPPPLSEK